MAKNSQSTHIMLEQGSYENAFGPSEPVSETTLGNDTLALLPLPTKVLPAHPDSLGQDDIINSIAPERPTAKYLADRQNRHVAAMLTRFVNLIKLAVAPEEDGAPLENQAAISTQMEVETGALVKATEDLHRLTRDLKELWLAGPLRSIGEDEGDGDMAADSQRVQELLNDITKKAREVGVGKDGKVH